MTAIRSEIPNYGLYGERREYFRQQTPHVEDIAQRSSRHGWEIAPHRHGRLFQILCIFEGQLKMQLDSDTRMLDGTWVLIVPAGVVHGFRFAPNSDGVVITLDTRIMPQVLDSSHPSLRKLTSTAAAIQCAGAEQARLLSYVELLRTEYALRDDFGQTISSHLVQLVLLAALREQQRNALYTHTVGSASRLLFEFRNLLEDHYRQHWRVEEYAKALGTSPSTLNRYCREHYGSSTKALILERLETEAKRRLIYTQQSLQEIAFYLGFQDPAYFSRLFKNRVGLTPGQFRASAISESNG